MKIDKESMKKGYVEMASINLGISNDCLQSEEQAYDKGVEYIAIQRSY